MFRLFVFIFMFLQFELNAQPTKKYKNFSISYQKNKGWVAMNKKKQLMYEVFPFDNGPDDPSEGLFRILVDGKIGYASISTGKIVIEPKYSCAYPFENGKAKVTFDCETIKQDEHRIWKSSSWFFIDKTGKKIPDFE